ncbi:MAG: hypothetical protein J6V88_03520 [Kiritimatiellae bacterium]|nr:hypothetical protein [Kiritimatiellia bacterium]
MKLGFYCVLSALILFPFISGCTHQKIVFDAKHPEIEVTNLGITFRGKFVEAQDVPDILEDYDVTKTDTINIFVDDNVKDLRLAYRLMGSLVQKGYRRPIIVGKEKAYSQVVEKKKNQQNIDVRKTTPASTEKKQRRTIRYK